MKDNKIIAEFMVEGIVFDETEDNLGIVSPD